MNLQVLNKYIDHYEKLRVNTYEEKVRVEEHEENYLQYRCSEEFSNLYSDIQQKYDLICLFLVQLKEIRDSK